MHSDRDRLLDFPAVKLGHWPTPICPVAQPGQHSILVKRDDLSGHGRGGVKTRKIERLVGYMLQCGYDELVTAVGNVTNLIHDIVPVLTQYDLRSTIFIADEPAMTADARQRLFQEVRDPSIQFTSAGKLSVGAAMLGAVRASRARGRRPFLVLPSLMHPAGVAGSACGFLEMAAQLGEAGIALPRRVYITVASGTTLAGFLVAEQLLRREGHPPIPIVGVQVYPGPTKLWVLGLIRWSERFLGLAGRVPAGRILLVSSALGGGFARFPRETAALCRSVKEQSGLTIDPIFGGKTWTVMAEQLARQGADDMHPVLYWHCGFTPDWPTIDQMVNQPDEYSR